MSAPLERVVSSEIVFRCPIFDVEHAVVELPDGRRQDRWYAVKPDAVIIVAVDDSGCFLLLREFRSAAGQEVWTLPSGRVAAGESPADAARRELREEAGVDGELELLESVRQPSASIKQTTHIFLARGLVSAPLEGDEAAGQIRVMPTMPAAAVALVEAGELDGKVARAVRLAAARLG